MMWKIVFITFAVGALADQLEDIVKKQLQEFFTEDCVKNESQMTEIAKAFLDYQKSIANLFDLQIIKTEFEEAIRNGTVDEAAKKYCLKTPELKNAMENLASKILPCLVSDFMKTYTNASLTYSIIDYVCYKEGSRITTFINEQGIECIQTKVQEIAICSTITADDLKNLSTHDICAKINGMTSCYTKKLEGCSSPTPSRMAKEYFTYFKNALCPQTSSQ